MAEVAPGARSEYSELAGTTLHWTAWGEPGLPVVLCVPGLSRNGRDFDTLARHLSGDFHVVCVDLPGRGLSQWADDPAQVYRLEWMQRGLSRLVDQLGDPAPAWVGTSYGGLVGILAAGGAMADRLRCLVVNDVGPAPLSEEAAHRIIGYLSAPPRFATVPDLESYYRSTYEPFGLTDDAQWRAFTEHSLRRNNDGTFSPDYDPRIADFLREPHNLWQYWERISADVLIVRGGRSDVLPAETSADMLARLPRSRELLVPACGHAPALNTAQQLDAIAEFLSRP